MAVQISVTTAFSLLQPDPRSSKVEKRTVAPSAPCHANVLRGIVTVCHPDGDFAITYGKLERLISERKVMLDPYG